MCVARAAPFSYYTGGRRILSGAAARAQKNMQVLVEDEIFRSESRSLASLGTQLLSAGTFAIALQYQRYVRDDPMPHVTLFVLIGVYVVLSVAEQEVVHVALVGHTHQKVLQRGIDLARNIIMYLGAQLLTRLLTLRFGAMRLASLAVPFLLVVIVLAALDVVGHAPRTRLVYVTDRAVSVHQHRFWAEEMRQRRSFVDAADQTVSATAFALLLLLQPRIMQEPFLWAQLLLLMSVYWLVYWFEGTLPASDALAQLRVLRRVTGLVRTLVMYVGTQILTQLVAAAVATHHTTDIVTPSLVVFVVVALTEGLHGARSVDDISSQLVTSGTFAIALVYQARVASDPHPYNTLTVYAALFWVLSVLNATIERVFQARMGKLQAHVLQRTLQLASTIVMYLGTQVLTRLLSERFGTSTVAEGVLPFLVVYVLIAVVDTLSGRSTPNT